jgi:hypothetical protein
MLKKEPEKTPKRVLVKTKNILVFSLKKQQTNVYK